ncbi:hypothetical protein PHYPSEUDO_011474 [Phytophthora pseudosyringae]|uniref:RxLR effector protein n=1 Tax=Phytophthora pseudosyringae TaxID=221518 RepID=A0A8T1W6T6_9STRA|nr:hypothetical protein PHYPSEUDO_011474 [Phytophthora pseudosyringae]
MQLLQFLLAIMVVLLASTDVFVAAANCGVKTTSTTAATDDLRAVNLAAASPDASPTVEERAGASTGAAARAIGGSSVHVNGGQGGTASDETVTVTTFNGNGLFQRMGKWWGRAFDHGRRLRQ